MDEKVPHPYVPRDLHIEGFIPNDQPMRKILTFIFSVSLSTLVLTLFMSGLVLRLSAARRLILSWFMLCVVFHLVFEGWFTLYYAIIPGDQSFFSQMWKEYGHGDSRYMIGDNFVVCMETITAWVSGPLSLWTVFAFLGNKPYRFVLQLIVSVGHMNNFVLYFFTEYRHGFIHTKVGHPLYFWFYFVFANALWVVIPSALILDAWGHISRAQRAADATLPSCKAKRN